MGIEYRRERVRQVLHALGVRLRRRRHRHRKAQPEEPAACVAELEAWVRDWPEEWERLCVDAATVRRPPPLTAQWCLGDDGPEVPTGDDHATVQVDGAVAPLTGRSPYHVSPEWGQKDCAPCLQPRLAYSPRKRRLVIHDRGEPPKGAPVEALLRGAGGRLRLKPQPASSPELNPQERLWKWLRRVVTHHHWCATLQEPIDAIRNCFRYLAGVKAQVRRLCGFTTLESLVA